MSANGDQLARAIVDDEASLDGVLDARKSHLVSRYQHRTW
jgi:hypothetical protein